MWKGFKMYMDCLQEPFFILGLVFASSLLVYPPHLAFLIAIAVALSYKIVFELLFVTNEGFCSIHRNRWCPESDRCLPEVDKGKKVQMFLDDTDTFIQELYDFLEPDAPAYVAGQVSEENEEDAIDPVETFASV